VACRRPSDQPQQLLPPSSPPQACVRRCVDRSDRQSVNSANPAGRQPCPNPWSEWSPTERFVSGSAPLGATRPFVDVQSVLCRTAPSSSPLTCVDKRIRSSSNSQQPLRKEYSQLTTHPLDSRGSPCRGVRFHLRKFDNSLPRSHSLEIASPWKYRRVASSAALAIEHATK
jgi:hypothetical protein